MRLVFALRACVLRACVLLACAPLALAAQSTYEEGARALVASPLETAGPRQVLLESWLERVERDPLDPLADAVFTLLRARFDEAEDPAALAERVLALDAARHEPIAERELLLLQGELAAAHWSMDELAERGPALRRGWIRHWWTLGPLGPLGDPLAVLGDEPGADTASLVAPGLGLPHRAAHGRTQRWQAHELAPWQVRFTPADLVERDTGWLLVATAFESAASVPAWIEFDARGSRGLYEFELAQGSARSSGELGNPSYAWSLNGASPRSVDFTPGERSGIERVQVLLREGVNRLVLRTQSGGHLSLALRLLDADGRALRYLPADAAAPLGPMPAGVLPLLPAPRGAEERLREWPLVAPPGQAELGPDARALLGLLALRDQRPHDGLGELARACELAPQRAELAALHARELVGAPSLPESWRRSSARALAERALAARPELADAALLVARALVQEGQEEQALPLLRRVGERGLVGGWLELERTYPRLDLYVPAEEALARAVELAPRAPAVLARQAATEAARGRLQAELLHWRTLHAVVGALPAVLDALADRHAALGEHGEAIELRREAALRSPSYSAQLALADALLAARRVDAARATYEELAQRRPLWAVPQVRLADCARLAGAPQVERAMLERALALEPAEPVLRERLRALTGSDPVLEQLRAWEADLQRERARYEAERWSESVVRVVDSAVVRYFEDGSSETLTRNLIALRDLAACKREGTQRFPGEALAVRVHGANGALREPVRAEGQWVLPGLVPGELVEVHYRNREGPRSDGALGPERWYFASLEDAYQLSRLVAIVPRAWLAPGPDGAPARLRMRFEHFDGTHEVHVDGAHEIHVFERRDSRRVVPEPLHAPREQFLPLVEFGARGSPRAAASRLMLLSRLKTRVSPWIRAQARSQLAGVEQRARELYERLPELVEQRDPASTAGATATLLERRGNAAYLYAALLRAADIEADLVWSREIPPQIEPDPDPLVLESGRWGNALYTLVRPGAGAPILCDPNTPDLPFGALSVTAPRAVALGGLSGQSLELPDVAPEQQPGARARVELVLDAALETRARIELGTSGHANHGSERNLRSAPQATLRNQFAQQGARLLPGFQLESFEVRGLDDEREPSFVLAGSVARWVDARDPLVELPLPPSRLAERYAGGEGERRLPYVLPRAQIALHSARIELPAGWKVKELPAETRLEFGGGRYVQAFRALENGRVIELEREVVLLPMALAPSEFAAWHAHCERADAAERVRLAFVRE